MSGNDGEARINFFETKELGERDWGQEILISHVPGKYTGKLIKIIAGKKGGLQKHRFKDESAYVHSGRMLIRYDDGNGELREKVLGPGDSVHFPPGSVHQEEAITDVIVFETSTPHFNDRVRMEDYYGVEDHGGLPTTRDIDVEFL
ncbi:MAG: cupin domain-containing protein [Candidatus Omnitrophica bacterium]|nr:cupin domain-containing protein [Candidatus Omnitrophota bacterium]